MTDGRKRFGDEGERAAAEFLRRAGLRVLARQVRVGRWGEIDIVAFERGTLVFVEVKTRSTEEYGPPEEAVTAAKRRKLARAIEAFRLARGLTDAPCRFDVVAVEGAGAAARIRHLRDLSLE